MKESFHFFAPNTSVANRQRYILKTLSAKSKKVMVLGTVSGPWTAPQGSSERLFPLHLKHSR